MLQNPFGTKGRTSILSYQEYCTSCATSFSVSKFEYHAENTPPYDCSIRRIHCFTDAAQCPSDVFLCRGVLQLVVGLGLAVR